MRGALTFTFSSNTYTEQQQQQQQNGLTASQPSINESSPLLSLSLPTFINESDEKWQLEQQQYTIQIEDDPLNEENKSDNPDNNETGGAEKDGTCEEKEKDAADKKPLKAQKEKVLLEDAENVSLMNTCGVMRGRLSVLSCFCFALC